MSEMQNLKNDEKSFLSSYHMEDYPRPSVTADIVTFAIRNAADDNYRRDPQKHLAVLLIQRGAHPHKLQWALPGGFLHPTETLEACAERELREETGVASAALLPVGVFSAPNRDPRGWIVSAAFLSILAEENVEAVGGDDALRAKWFDVDFSHKDDVFTLRLTNGETVLQAVLRETAEGTVRQKFETLDSGGLAFDHAEMIAKAMQILRSGTKNLDLIFDFLPEKFTLTQMQRVQELVTGMSELPANFRRKVAGTVIETEEYVTGAGHRPAKLFIRRTEEKQ